MVDIEDLESIKSTLRMVDKPFITHLWESAKKKKSVLGEYFKLINAKDFRKLTWENSDNKSDEIEIVNNENEKQTTSHVREDNFVVTDALIDKWGYGYEQQEYKLFEHKWDKLINNYGEKTSLHTENLKTYIRFRVKEELATAKGLVKDAKEWGQLASKAAQDAKINVSQLSKSDISGGVDVLAQLAEAIESVESVIGLLPKILEQPYDDADLIIWANVNYMRKLEDKPKVSYREIWNFYDEMLEEHFKSQGYNEEQIEEFKRNRNNVFRDLEEIYIEPLDGEYSGDENE